MKRTHQAPVPAWRLREWLGPGLVVVLSLGLLLAGVLLLGTWTRRQIAAWDRYAYAFSDIDCLPPPGLTRTEFLAEVQYLSKRPPQFSVLEEQLARNLAEAFARHPWVRQVESVAIRPPRQVEVRLSYRRPTLAVPWGGGVRVVDESGVLLPASAPASGLPLLQGPVPPPAGTAGQLWGDAAVEEAARTLAFLQPDQDQLQLTAVELTTGGLVLISAAGSRIRWGRAPHDATAADVPDAVKRERLLHYCAQHGSLDKPAGPYEHDVRPAAAPIHRPRR